MSGAVLQRASQQLTEYHTRYETPVTVLCSCCDCAVTVIVRVLRLCCDCAVPVLCLCCACAVNVLCCGRYEKRLNTKNRVYIRKVLQVLKGMLQVLDDGPKQFKSSGAPPSPPRSLSLSLPSPLFLRPRKRLSVVCPGCSIYFRTTGAGCSGEKEDGGLTSSLSFFFSLSSSLFLLSLSSLSFFSLFLLFLSSHRLPVVLSPRPPPSFVPGRTTGRSAVVSVNDFLAAAKMEETNLFHLERYFKVRTPCMHAWYPIMLLETGSLAL